MSMMVQYRCLLIAMTALCETRAFLQTTPFYGVASIDTNTAHFMGRKVKPSMAERRKKRAQRTVHPDLETVRSIDKVVEPPPPTPSPTVEARPKRDTGEAGQKADSLLALQRRVRTMEYLIIHCF
jgi:hypothetical protein